MSKSIFAACKAPAPAFCQADLPIVPTVSELRGADSSDRAHGPIGASATLPTRQKPRCAINFTEVNFA